MEKESSSSISSSRVGGGSNSNSNSNSSGGGTIIRRREGGRKQQQQSDSESESGINEDNERAEPKTSLNAIDESKPTIDLERGENSEVDQQEKPDKPARRNRGQTNDNDNDNNNNSTAPSKMDTAMMGPLRILEPVRTDPIKIGQQRRRRLERLATESMPEIHYVGQIASCVGLIKDTTEGACIRWKIDHGQSWEHLGGELQGQTQMSYCQIKETEMLPLNHPIDIHFAEAGLQGFGGPRVAVQSYKMDWHGRRILSGYGFIHLPTSPGYHRLEISLWRPSGNPEQELEAFLLGKTPALVSHEPLYESAWKERCRLVTVTAGKVFMDIYVVTRFSMKQGIDE